MTDGLTDCSPPSTAHAIAHPLKHEALRATCACRGGGVCRTVTVRILPSDGAVETARGCARACVGAGRHTCSLLLAQQRTREQPTMPVMKMAMLKLKIAKTSIAAAQHFMSLSAAALILMGSSFTVQGRAPSRVGWNTRTSIQMQGVGATFC